MIRRLFIVLAIAALAVTVVGAVPAAKPRPKPKPKPKPPPVGSLKQLGCIADAKAGDLRCAKAQAIANAAFLAVSPDGKFVYVTARDSDAITVFRRNARTGGLAQLSGPSSCVVDAGQPGCATSGHGLDRPSGVIVSPDGRNVYVAGTYSNAVLTFTRDPATGGITQSGCISDANQPETGCEQTGKGLRGAQVVTVAPDGRHVYVAALDSAAVAAFSRDPGTGALTELGCISNQGVDKGCAPGNGLDGAAGVTVSRDGRNVYVAGSRSSAVASFTRDPATGGLTQLGCVSGDAGYRQDEKCAPGRGIQFAQYVTVSPDGRFAYASATDSHTIVIFSRDRATGALTQLAGTAGCMRDSGYEGRSPCLKATGIALPLAIALTRNGRYGYIGAFGYGSVTAFARNAKTGLLKQIGKCISNDDPRCPGAKGLVRAGFLALSPDERHVYVNAPSSSSIAIFARVTGAARR